MNPPTDPDLTEERFLDLLEAYDQALAAGDDADAAPTHPDLRGAHACLDLLEEVWPRRQAPAEPAPPPSLPPVPSPFGRFQVVRELGRGGFGIVFLALDPVLGRQVALKVPRPEVLLTPALRQRFLREARAAAALDHPQVVPVYEAGEAGGVCYIASAYIEGPTLATWLKTHAEPVPLRAAAELVAVLAEAVDYTHRHGVLHRDLKPSNILLAQIEDRGSRIEDRESKIEDRTTAVCNPRSSILDPRSSILFPKITDFGLARHMAEESPASVTTEGLILGTPQYMAPEQADGQLSRVGPCTDIYALGALLYELLTRRPPFTGKSNLEILRRVTLEEVEPPSRLRPKVHRDLETICLKCLHKQPRRRYPRAGALAEDLRRFLNGEPIQARPVSLGEHGWRWCRRHPALASVSAVSLAALLVVLPGVLWYQARLGAARAAEQAAQEIAALAGKAEEEAHRAEAAAHEAATTQEYFALVNGVRERSVQAPPGWTWAGLADLEKAGRLPTSACNPAALRSEAAACLAGVDLRPRNLLVEHFSAAVLAFHPNGKLLAVGQFKAPAHFGLCSAPLVDVASGTVTRTLHFWPSNLWQGSKTPQDGVRALAFSADGKRLALGTRGGKVHCWDLTEESAPPVTWCAHKEVITGLAFAPDGMVLFSSSEDRSLLRWDVTAGGKKLAGFDAGGKVAGLALSPRGDVVACSGSAGVALLDATNLQPLRPPWPGGAGPVAFSPDGRTLAGEAGQRLVLRRVDTGETFAAFQDPALDALHEGKVDRLEFDATGTLLLSLSGGDRDRKVKLWDVSTGRLLATHAAAGTDGMDAHFGPDGRLLAITASGRTATLDLGGLEEQTLLTGPMGTVRALAFSRDGRWLTGVADLGAGGGGAAPRELCLWEPAANPWPRRLAPLEAAGEGRSSVAVAPGGNLLACSGASGLLLVDPAEGQERGRVAAREATSPAFDREGRRLWAVVEGNTLQSWALPEGQVATRWRNVTSEVMSGLGGLSSCVAGDEWVLAGGRDGAARLLRARDGKYVQTWPGDGTPMRCVALSADERLAAWGTQKGEVRVVGVPSGEEVFRGEAHRDAVEAVAFSADAGLLVTGSRDRTVALWMRDGATYRPWLTLRTGSGPVTGLALSADGQLLAVAMQKERGVRLWHLDRLRTRLAELGLETTR
jgi:serine/threonine protein kinase/WD40 repeat protein